MNCFNVFNKKHIFQEKKNPYLLILLCLKRYKSITNFALFLNIYITLTNLLLYRK